MVDCGRCWLFPAVESQSETEQMTVDPGTSSETGSAPILEDLLDQQEAGPTASSLAPKASYGQWSELATDPECGFLSADLGRLSSAEPPPPAESTEQTNQQGEPERDEADDKQAPPNDGAKVRLRRRPRLWAVTCAGLTTDWSTGGERR